MERAGVEWQKDWPVYFRHAVILDQHGKQFTDWTSGTMAEAKKKFDVEMVCALTLGPPGPNWKPLEIMTCQHCGEKYPADLTDFCPSCGSCNNQPQMSCPKCGAVYDDYGGTGLSYCPACGYCIHPAETTVNEKTICCVCGRETNRREKKNNEEN